MPPALRGRKPAGLTRRQLPRRRKGRCTHALRGALRTVGLSRRRPRVRGRVAPISRTASQARCCRGLHGPPRYTSRCRSQRRASPGGCRGAALASSARPQCRSNELRGGPCRDYVPEPPPHTTASRSCLSVLGREPSLGLSPSGRKRARCLAPCHFLSRFPSRCRPLPGPLASRVRERPAPSP